jgi:hypothetical protein
MGEFIAIWAHVLFCCSSQDGITSRKKKKTHKFGLQTSSKALLKVLWENEGKKLIIFSRSSASILNIEKYLMTIISMGF